MSEQEDQLKKMIRGLPRDDQHRDEHLKQVCLSAMSEFDKAAQTAAGFNHAQFRFTPRRAVRAAVAALLLVSASFGVTFYFEHLRHAEPQQRSGIAGGGLTPIETQLAASLQRVEDDGAGQGSDARDRAIDACLTWHLSRAAEAQ